MTYANAFAFTPIPHLNIGSAVPEVRRKGYVITSANGQINCNDSDCLNNAFQARQTVVVERRLAELVS